MVDKTDTHLPDIADMNDKALRVKTLELAVKTHESFGKPADVLPTAEAYLKFLTTSPAPGAPVPRE